MVVTGMKKSGDRWGVRPMAASNNQSFLNLGVCIHNIGELSSRVFPGGAYGAPARAHVLDVVRLTERDNRSSRKESLRLRLQNLFSTGRAITRSVSHYPHR